MYKNIVSLVLVLVVIGLVHTQSGPSKQRQQRMRRIYRSLCGSNVSKDKLDAAKECEEDLPEMVVTGFQGCVKEVFKVNKMTKPMACYRGQKGGDRMVPCLERRARALKSKAPKGIDLEKLRNKFLDQYAECLEGVVQQK